MRLVVRWSFPILLLVVAMSAACELAPEEATRVREMRHFPDSSMIARLDREAATFDSLLVMLAEDPQIRGLFLEVGFGLRVDDGSPGAGLLEPGQGLPGLPPERVATYARLLQRLGIHYQVTVDPGRVELLQEVQKIVPPGIRRGYLWSATPLESCVTNEDLMSDALWTDELIRRSATHYRPVRDGWYLFTTAGYRD